MPAGKTGGVLIVFLAMSCGDSEILACRFRCRARYCRTPCPSRTYQPACSSPAFQPEALLYWKFRPGVPFYQEFTTETRQTMTVMNMEVKQVHKQTFYVRWIPLEEIGGTRLFRYQIIGVKMDIDIGGNRISYDSTDPYPAQRPMMDFYKALLKLKLTFGIDCKRMEVTKIEGMQKFVKKYAKNPHIDLLVKSLFSEDALKKMVEPVLFTFPTGFVFFGTSWTRTSRLDLGPIGSYKTVYFFTYQGKEKCLDKIGIKVSVVYSPPKGKGTLPFTIVAARLEENNGTGTAYYNPRLGRIDKYDMTIHLEGYLTIDIGGLKTKMDLIQDQRTRVRTYNRNPLRKHGP